MTELWERQWPIERCRDTVHIQTVSRDLLAGLEMHTYTHTHTINKHTHTYIHIYICINTYTYIHTYI